jgi:transcriptional regulator with XRE-family HTH domain
MVDIDKIRSLRMTRGWTMEQAAKKAKFTSRQAWHNVESGKRRNIQLAVLERIAKALGVKAGDLLK